VGQVLVHAAMPCNACLLDARLVRLAIGLHACRLSTPHCCTPCKACDPHPLLYPCVACGPHPPTAGAGATLVLFCAEMASAIYRGLFERAWEEGCYVRTSCFRTSAAAAVLPAGAPAEINAKSIHLKHVPVSEAWCALWHDACVSSQPACTEGERKGATCMHAAAPPSPIGRHT